MTTTERRPMTASDSHLLGDSQQQGAVAGPHLPADQTHAGIHGGIVGGDLNSPGPANDGSAPITRTPGPVTPTPEPTNAEPTPRAAASVRALTSPTARSLTIPMLPSPSGTPNSDNGPLAGATQAPRAVVAPTPPAPAKSGSAPTLGALTLADPNVSKVDQITIDTHRSHVDLADPLLALAADVLDDLERVRIANENRLRQLTRDETDVDGEERGFGLTLDHPDVARLAALVDALAKAEHQAELNLKRQLRKRPLGPWVKQARGVGEKQAARLLAAVGDPYWNDLHGRPRLVSELWSYSGYGDAVRQVRQRGVKANWSADAKMRAHLVAVSIVKSGGPYREVYDKARAKYTDAIHDVPCKRCGPSGKPAGPGSPLAAGHQHARALRAVAKEVLRDLWREAKRLHEHPGGHAASDTQVVIAAGGPT